MEERKCAICKRDLKHEDVEEMPCCGKEICYDPCCHETFLDSGIVPCPLCGTLLIYDKNEYLNEDGYLRTANAGDIPEEDIVVYLEIAKTVMEAESALLINIPDLLAALDLSDEEWDRLKNQLLKLMEES